jgi:hypothetical protein
MPVTTAPNLLLVELSPVFKFRRSGAPDPQQVGYVLVSEPRGFRSQSCKLMSLGSGEAATK